MTHPSENSRLTKGKGKKLCILLSVCLKPTKILRGTCSNKLLSNSLCISVLDANRSQSNDAGEKKKINTFIFFFPFPRICIENLFFVLTKAIWTTKPATDLAAFSLGTALSLFVFKLYWLGRIFLKLYEYISQQKKQLTVLVNTAWNGFSKSTDFATFSIGKRKMREWGGECKEYEIRKKKNKGFL